MKRDGWSGMRLKRFSNMCEGDGKHFPLEKKLTMLFQNFAYSFSFFFFLSLNSTSILE